MKNKDDLISAIFSVKDRASLERLFGEIFTSPERKDFMLRWELMKLLALGVPQRKISERLGVSLCKITRGSKIIGDPASVAGSIIRNRLKIIPQG